MNLMLQYFVARILLPFRNFARMLCQREWTFDWEPDEGLEETRTDQSMLMNNRKCEIVLQNIEVHVAKNAMSWIN